MGIATTRIRDLARPLCLAASAIVVVGTGAEAWAAPNLSLEVIETTTGYAQTFNPAGSLGPLFHTYDIAIDQPGAFTVNGSINANADIPTTPDGIPALLSSTLSFTNNYSDTLNFIVTMTLSMDTGNTPVNWNTSASWVLTGPSSGAELYTIPDMPLWAVSIDGTQVASLYDHGSGMGGSGSGPYDLSTYPKSGTFGAVEGSISIQLAFSLTPGATGGPTGAFTLVPGPGAAVMFAGMALCGPRRRRK